MCFVLIWEKQRLMSFFIQDSHLNFHSFLGLQHGSGSSIKAIMLLSAALPLPIGLNFLVCNSIIVISKVSHVDYLSSILKVFAYQTKLVFKSILSVHSGNGVTSMIELTLIFNPSYVCCPTIWTFSGQHLFQNFLGVSEENSANLGIT